MTTSRILAPLTAILLLLSFSSAMAAPAVTPNTVKEGDAVPAFKGRDLDGNEVDVGAMLGEKVVVFAFWSIYCKPCVEEISSLIRLENEFGGSEVEVIGINTDSELGVGRIRKFIGRFEEFEKKSINYTIIYDEKNAISELLGVKFLPTVLSVNTDRQVDGVYVGFEEESEEEIFEGIRALLPSYEETAEEDRDFQVFTVEASVPLCGFYGDSGWVGSFRGNTDLNVELEKAAQAARAKSSKLILRQALLSLGINLAETAEDDCLRPYGVSLEEDPLAKKDNLSNLIRELTINRLVRSQDLSEDFLGTEYRVLERARVDLSPLRDALERLGYVTSPRTITLSVINVNKLDQAKFEKALLEQSRFIGFFSFPNYTIYTTAERFAEEMQKMDFPGLRFFIEDIDEEMIEVEVWR